MKRITLIMTAIPAALCLLAAGCTQNSSSSLPDLPEETSAAAEITQQSSAESPESSAAESQKPAESQAEPDVQVEKNLWRVAAPAPASEEEKSVTPCICGTAYPGQEITLGGRTVNFASVCQTVFPNETVSYCVSADGSTLYYAAGGSVYRSDLALTAPETVCTPKFECSHPELCFFAELQSFSNTDLLFFRVQREHPLSGCIGSIDPKTGTYSIEVLAGNSLSTVRCNTGLIVYDWEAKKKSTVYYWERGSLRTVTLRNRRESDFAPLISANGKYLCTKMTALAKDSQLAERYSVYDVQSGAYLAGFDAYSPIDSRGASRGAFAPQRIDEKRQLVSLVKKTDLKFYEFRFGESP